MRARVKEDNRPRKTFVEEFSSTSFVREETETTVSAFCGAKVAQKMSREMHTSTGQKQEARRSRRLFLSCPYHEQGHADPHRQQRRQVARFQQQQHLGCLSGRRRGNLSRVNQPPHPKDEALQPQGLDRRVGWGRWFVGHRAAYNSSRGSFGRRWRRWGCSKRRRWKRVVGVRHDKRLRPEGTPCEDHRKIMPPTVFCHLPSVDVYLK